MNPSYELNIGFMSSVCQQRFIKFQVYWYNLEEMLFYFVGGISTLLLLLFLGHWTNK